MSKLVFSGGNRTTEKRADAQYRKEIGGDDAAGDRLRLSFAAQVDDGVTVDRKLVEDVVLIAPVQVVCRGDGKLSHSWKAFCRRHMPHLHQSSGILVG